MYICISRIHMYITLGTSWNLWILACRCVFSPGYTSRWSKATCISCMIARFQESFLVSGKSVAHKIWWWGLLKPFPPGGLHTIFSSCLEPMCVQGELTLALDISWLRRRKKSSILDHPFYCLIFDHGQFWVIGQSNEGWLRYVGSPAWVRSIFADTATNTRDWWNHRIMAARNLMKNFNFDSKAVFFFASFEYNVVKPR